MNKNDMTAALNAMLEQGNQQRASELVPVLRRLAEMGISQDMSEEQQMEARKNLGLYYEETSVGEKTAEFNETAEQVSGWYKISDDIITESDIIDTIANGQSCEFTWEKEDAYNTINIKFNVNGSEVLCFKVSDGEFSPLFPHGIYATEVAGVIQAKLVYKGEVTTVSKIDAKFLPEQEDTLPWLDVTELPGIDEDYVDLSTYISQSDWNDLLDGKYIGIHVLPNQITKVSMYYMILSVVKAPMGFIHPCVILGNFGVVGFDADRQNVRILYLIGSSTISMSVRHVTLISSIPEPLILTALPETSITTQTELDAIGLTAVNVQKLVNGGASILCLKNSGGFVATRLNLEYATYLASNNFELRFTDNTHRYSVSKASGKITVTKTSLS